MTTTETPTTPTNFEAAITEEEQYSMEIAATSQGRGQQRRLCFLACARSADKLRQLLSEEPKAFLEMFEMIEVYQAHAKSMADMAEAAYARMILVGSEAEDIAA